METIQTHDFQDIYRIENGILLTVNKFKEDRHVHSWNIDKKNKRKIKGIKNCYEIIDVDASTSAMHIKKNDIVFGNYIIRPTKNPEEYKFIISTNDGIKGDMNKCVYFLEKIKDVIKKYKKI